MTTTTDQEIVTCPACGQKNRIPAAAGSRQPVCGRCGTALEARPGGPVTITEANFEEEVIRSPLPVLLDCWAPWCGPCRMIAPVIDRLAGELAGRVKVAKLNVDDHPGLAAHLRIQGIPALKVFRDGRVVAQMVGAAPREEILRLVQPHLR